MRAALHATPASRLAQRALRGAIASAGIHSSGARLLVMVSGGADSTALAALLAELPRGARPAALDLLWCDHRLRDTSADEAAVQMLADALRATTDVEITLHIERAPDGLFGPHAPGNLHDAAREWRYGTAARLAAAHGCVAVCTAHHADDIAEGALLGLARGGGLRALAAIAPLSERLTDGGTITLLRPLLTVERQTLRSFTSERGLAYIDDPANDDATYARARVRTQLLPALTSIHPAAAQSLVAVGREARDSVNATSELAQIVLGYEPLSAALIAALPHASARAIISEWVRTHAPRSALTRASVDAVHAAAQQCCADGSMRSVDVPGGRITVERDAVRYSAGDNDAEIDVNRRNQGATRAR